LERAGLAFSAECYSPDDELLGEWRAGSAEPLSWPTDLNKNELPGSG
jgi:hypothetical protein